MSFFVQGKKILTPKGHRLAGFTLLVCGIGITALCLAFPQHTPMDTPNVISGVIILSFGARSVWIGYRDK